MEINSAFSTALSGIQRGMQGLDRNAAELASVKMMEGNASPVEPLVESKVNSLQVAANAKMVSTLDETLGTLLDIRA